MNFVSKKFSLLVLIASTMSFHLSAQSTSTAQLAGQVSDGKGAPVADAQVRLVDTERGNIHRGRTDRYGHYTLPNLEIAPYRLEISHDGFISYTQLAIVLHVGDNREINVGLHEGKASERSEMTIGANLVQTEQVAVSQIISRKSILELPLNGRNPTQLVLISGASVVTPLGDMATSKNYPTSTTISIAGGQPNGTNYLLDGGFNLDTFTNVNLPLPFPDALQEFGVDTSIVPARSGYLAGGVVTLITKSGGNDFHGNVFEFVRNGIFNAWNRFSTSPDALKRNQFGGTLGGPVRLPGLFNGHDKLFFFGGFQDTRTVSQPGNNFAYVPTAQEIAGDFTTQESPTCQSSGKAKTLTGYASNMIPTGQFDPAAVALLKYLPSSSDPCGKVSYGLKSVSYEAQTIGRVDWNVSSRHQLYGRYFLADYLNPPPNGATNLLLTSAPGIQEKVNTFTFGDSFAISPQLLNAFHGTVARRGETRGNDAGIINPNALGIKVYAPLKNDIHVAVTNDFSVGCGTCPTARYGTTSFELADDLDLVKGRHHLGFGMSVVRSDDNNSAFYDSNGLNTFNGGQTGDPMADFLLGSLSAFVQSRNVVQGLRQTALAPYVQDSIRLNKHLLLTGGVRWEPHIFPNEIHGRGATFSASNFAAGTHSAAYPGAPAGALYNGDAGVSSNFAKTLWSNVSPRLGIVWDPAGKGRETLRVGAGSLYDTQPLFALQRLTYDPPFVNEIDLTASKPGGFSDPWVTGYNYPGGNPFPVTSTSFPVSGAWVYVKPNMKSTRTNEWNVTYQRQLGNDWIVEASYLGSRTNHVWGGIEQNPAIYSTAVCAQFTAGCTTGNTAARRVLNQANAANGKYYGNVTLIDDGANATYDGLLTSVNHRLTKGISVLANYTWSHCISDVEANGDISSDQFMNPANPHQDRGSCAYDLRHIMNASVVQTVGFGGHDLKSKVVGQWQLAPLVRVTSGIPLNIVSGKDYSLTGVGLDRPNYSATPVVRSTSTNKLQYLNPAAFTPNAAGTFGDVGRDAARGPGAFNFDLGLTRLIPINSRYEFQFRCDTFNVLNKVNLVAPSTSTGIPGISPSGINLNLSSATFGQITSAGDPRIIQFAGKLSF